MIAVAIALALAASQPARAQAPAYPHLRDNPAARIFPQMAVRVPAARPSAMGRDSGMLLPVTQCGDDGPGSLRAAVAGAGDGDTVDLSQLECSVISLQTGAIVVPVDNLALQGPGAVRLAIDGGGSDRVIIDGHGGELVIRDLTIRNGAVSVSGLGITGGACIADAGYLTLERSVVSGCTASAEGVYGGGLYAGVLTMIGSTVSGNLAWGDLAGTGTAASGGGAYAVYAYLIDSTVTGNAALHQPDPPRVSYDLGGGLMIGRGGSLLRSIVDHNIASNRGGGIASIGDLSITDSTVSGNTAQSESGGGVFMRIPGVLALANSTVTGNRAGDGGGVAWSPRGGSIDSTIVHGNSASTGAADMTAGTALTLTGGHNIIGVASPLLALPTDTLAVDPGLLSLAANGGMTRSHALRAGSPAIDAGSNESGLVFDQRGPGQPRVVGAAADVGAYEWASPPPAVAVSALAGPARWWLVLGLAGVAAASRRRRATHTPALVP